MGGDVQNSSCISKIVYYSLKYSIVTSGGLFNFYGYKKKPKKLMSILYKLYLIFGKEHKS